MIRHYDTLRPRVHITPADYWRIVAITLPAAGFAVELAELADAAEMPPPAAIVSSHTYDVTMLSGRRESRSVTIIISRI